MKNEKCKNCKNEAGIVLISPQETQCSVKIYDAAGSETRIEVKAYGDKIENVSKQAQDEYDKLKKRYPFKND